MRFLVCTVYLRNLWENHAGAVNISRGIHSCKFGGFPIIYWRKTRRTVTNKQTKNRAIERPKARIIRAQEFTRELAKRASAYIHNVGASRPVVAASNNATAAETNGVWSVWSAFGGDCGRMPLYFRTYFFLSQDLYIFENTVIVYSFCNFSFHTNVSLI